MTIIATPIAWLDPSLAAEEAIATTPAAPVASPTVCNRPGARRSSTEVTTAARMGRAPLSIPATADVTCSCAKGKSVHGTATHRAATTTTLARSARAIGWRAPGRNTSASAPDVTLPQVTSPGSKARSAISLPQER